MQLEATTLYVHPRIGRPRIPSPHLYSDEELLRFGGLDPAVRRAVQQEMQLLLAPILPVLAGGVFVALATVLWAVGQLFATMFSLEMHRRGQELVHFFYVYGALCAVLSAGLVGLSWALGWARSQPRPKLAFSLGLLAICPPPLVGVCSRSLIAHSLATLAVVIAYPMIRSLLSRRYCLARLVAFERCSSELVGDPFVFDTRVLNGWGWSLLPVVWLFRVVSRPFIVASDRADRARLVWPELE